MSIQDRLQQLADDGYIMNEAISRIIQVFADEQKARDSFTRALALNEIGLMTGNEWYDRFEKEFKNSLSSDPTEVAYEADKAAKRAAGIKIKDNI